MSVDLSDLTRPLPPPPPARKNAFLVIEMKYKTSICDSEMFFHVMISASVGLVSVGEMDVDRLRFLTDAGKVYLVTEAELADMEKDAT